MPQGSTLDIGCGCVDDSNMKSVISCKRKRHKLIETAKKLTIISKTPYIWNFPIILCKQMKIQRSPKVDIKLSVLTKGSARNRKLGCEMNKSF